MSIPNKYFIRKIDNNVAQSVVKREHYLHRVAPCSYAYGLFEKKYLNMFGEWDGEMVGVILYGSPASPSLVEGLCGKDEVGNVVELTRLWIKDGTEKNVESYLIGNTLRLLPVDIVVSFADPSCDGKHVGYVYQATNWIYTGMSVKRRDRKIPNDTRHSRTVTNGMNLEQMIAKYGDTLELEDRAQKHRYVYFNGSKKRKKELLAKLRYPILPYSKKEMCDATKRTD